MKLANLVGERFKERPSECVIDSHALMIRGGYIKYVANGIYSSFPPLKRVTKKIEQIIREEMDKIDGQEVSFPVVLPAKLWEESGRYESVGSELVRFSDRNESKLLLGMTHEEAAVQLVREYGQSYSKYPFMIYQVQTKFRDEARPRGGLIRVREFVMKDAYSFHTSQQDLDAYYAKCHQAYERIFARVGIPETVSVLSDSGMMGGSVSHEFMLLTPAGEDSIVICRHCDYKSNMEAAENIPLPAAKQGSQVLNLVHTPDAHTIESLCDFLHVSQDKTCKAVVYQQKTDDQFVVVFLRGDYEINEAKLKNILGCEVYPAVIDDTCGLTAGFIGPYQLSANCKILFDRTLENEKNLVCGANRPDYHYTGLDLARDIGAVSFVDVAKVKENGICPVCKRKSLTVRRGIEVGNIFQLGTKYTKAMQMTYLDENGQSHYPIMGCYGIGIGRLAASVCEAHHDEYGPIWPLSIAPWQVHLCAVRSDHTEVKACADRLYEQMQEKGIEVIYDDRTVSAGVMFSDADLLGCPIRVIVSPRNCKNGVLEIVRRDQKTNEKIEQEKFFDVLQAMLKSKA